MTRSLAGKCVSADLRRELPESCRNMASTQVRGHVSVTQAAENLLTSLAHRPFSIDFVHSTINGTIFQKLN